MIQYTSILRKISIYVAYSLGYVTKKSVELNSFVISYKSYNNSIHGILKGYSNSTPLQGYRGYNNSIHSLLKHYRGNNNSIHSLLQGYRGSTV